MTTYEIGERLEENLVILDRSIKIARYLAQDITEDYFGRTEKDYATFAHMLAYQHERYGAKMDAVDDALYEMHKAIDALTALKKDVFKALDEKEAC